jgi:hypothetical protein
MEILTLLASPSNVYEIVGELTEYARDISPEIARQAVKAVGRIALSVRWGSVVWCWCWRVRAHGCCGLCVCCPTSDS